MGNTKQVALAAPTFEEIRSASEVYRNWLLHYYQLLWFHEPKLTSPGRGARPLSIEFDPDHIACLKAIVPQNPEFNFAILCFLNGKTQGEYDAEFVGKARRIADALKVPYAKVNPRACCSFAVLRDCVCAVSFACDLHGQQCIGTHD